MKTKNIFKALALAMLMPAMVLTTACSSEDDLVNNENTATKGYALPVTINVSRQGDEGTTRATYTYNEGTKKGTLAFSEGDKLFVSGQDNNAGSFKGVLTWVSGGTFSGSINTQNEYTGTADALLTDAASVTAILLPAGYESYAFLSIKDETDCSAWVDMDLSKAFALTKKAAVEQFSYESAYSYSSGFALSPETAIVSFSISGLAANTEVAVLFKDNYDISATPVNVTTDASGVATFAVAVNDNDYIDYYTLTVDGIDITLPDKTAEKGHIYNISRSVAPATDLSTINANYTASNGETLTGTLANNVKISIADGATVILNGVSINANGGWTSGDYAGITCEGNATIILSGTNAVTGFDGTYPGIHVPVGSTVTINGSGSLTASGNGGGAGIGGGWSIACGNIEIQGGTITATGGNESAGIGGGRDANCGNITISGGTVTATGGDYAAGIGSGTCSEASCGSITISGGTVTATGGEWAPGIGSSAFGSSCGAITITSGVTHVTATKGEEAPNSIGAGDMGSSCGTVSIEDPSKVTQN